MAYSRFSLFPDVWNDEIQHTQQGIIDTKRLKRKLNSAPYILYKIPIAYKFRPDLISQEFYGSGKLYWILTYINDINDSPAGFDVLKIIKIPNPKLVSELI